MLFLSSLGTRFQQLVELSISSPVPRGELAQWNLTLWSLVGSGRIRKQAVHEATVTGLNHMTLKWLNWHLLLDQHLPP